MGQAILPLSDALGVIDGSTKVGALSKRKECLGRGRMDPCIFLLLLPLSGKYLYILQDDPSGWRLHFVDFDLVVLISASFC